MISEPNYFLFVLVKRLDIRIKARHILFVLLALQEVLEGKKTPYTRADLDCAVRAVENEIIYCEPLDIRRINIRDIGLFNQY